jgi:Kdo2-lipid IVA lauroyltransferase/acyltransferase
MNDVAASAPAAHDYVHSFRRNFLSAERSYRLGANGLEVRDRTSARVVAYRDIVEIREYKGKVWGALAAQLPRSFDYVLCCRDGRKFIVNSIHRPRPRVAENRSLSCTTLVAALRTRVAAANPDVKSFNKLRWSYRLANAADRLRDRAGLLLFKLVRRIDVDRAANIAASTLRRIGPLLRGHRTARANLMAAYPEKSAAEIERMLGGMWEHLGRLGVEYANLDRICKDDPRCESSRVFFAPGTLEKVQRMRDDGKSAVLFTAHLANYEVGAITSARQGLNMAVLYRRQNIGPVAEQIVKMRADSMGHVIAAGPDSVWRIREALKRGMHVAMLLDQHSAQGVEVSFFGRTCKVNPMPVRFAQLFDCPIFGARSIRLPGNRIRFEFTDELKLPRGADGKIDVSATMQMITAMIEGWIREYPEQWMWLQRRWR